MHIEYYFPKYISKKNVFATTNSEVLHIRRNKKHENIEFTIVKIIVCAGMTLYFLIQDQETQKKPSFFLPDFVVIL